MKARLKSIIAGCIVALFITGYANAQALDWEFSGSLGGWGGLGWAENSTVQVVNDQMVISAGNSTYLRAGNFSATVDISAYPYLAVKVPQIPVSTVSGADWIIQSYFSIGGGNHDFKYYVSSSDVTLLGSNIYVIKWNPKNATDATAMPTTGTLTGGMYIDFGDRLSGEVAKIDWIRSYSSISDIDVTAPTAPTSLVTTNITPSRVGLSWTASTDNVGVAAYNIYQDGANVGTTTGTTYTITGLSALTLYNFAVKALDSEGNISGFSNTVAGTTTANPDIQAPTDPTGLAVTTVIGTTISLSWTASTDDVGVYRYFVYQDETSIATITGISYDVAGLASATTYTFKVQARDEAGNLSGFSNTITGTTFDVEAPTAPTGLTVTSIDGTTLSLNWTASTDAVGVAGYNIYLDGVIINATLVSTITYTTPTPAETGSYTVKAVDAAGNISAASGAVTWNVTEVGKLDWEFTTIGLWKGADWVENSPVTVSGGQLVISGGYGGGANSYVRAYTSDAVLDIAKYPYLALKVTQFPMTTAAGVAADLLVQPYFAVNGSNYDFKYYYSAGDIELQDENLYVIKLTPKIDRFGTVSLPETGTLIGGIFIDFGSCATGETAKIDWIRSFKTRDAVSDSPGDTTTTTAVDEQSLLGSQISVYPNPSSTGKVKIYFENSIKGHVAINVYNVNGSNELTAEGTKQSNVFEKELEIGHLAKGIHLVRIQLNNKVISKSIVVE